MRRGRAEATAGFFLLISWLIYLDEQVLLPLTGAACMLHELGHAAAAQRVGCRVSRLRLTASGAVMTITPEPAYLQEAVIALSGPGINLGLAFLLAQVNQFALFAGINLLLGLFNLLPIGTLDGGRFLRCTLSVFLPAEAAQRICHSLSALLSLLCLAAGGWLLWQHGNITLLCVGGWLISASNLVKKNVFGTCHAARKRLK